MVQDRRIAEMFDTVEWIESTPVFRAYKIMEVVDGSNKTLFHALNGSRTVPRERWLKANNVMCKDGTSKTSYLSGWHVLPTREECEAYLKSFKKRLEILEIVECHVMDLRCKEHSPSNVWLSNHILINEVN